MSDPASGHSARRSELRREGDVESEAGSRHRPALEGRRRAVGAHPSSSTAVKDAYNGIKAWAHSLDIDPRECPSP